MDTFVQDLRYGARMLIKRPILTAIAVLSLALGIGANATIFTMIRAVFLSPIPVADSGGLVEIYTQDARGTSFQFAPTSYPNARDYREQNTVLEGMAVVLGGLPAGLRVEGDQTAPQNVPITVVSGNYFGVLGVEAAAGNLFHLSAAEDERPGAHDVAVLSYGIWQTRFAADSAVVGATVLLNNIPFTVVGVATENFKGTQSIGNPNQIWVHASMRELLLPPGFVEWFDDRRALLTTSFGRLKPGVTLEQAQADFTNIASRLESEYPEPNGGRTAQLVAFSPVNPNQRGQFAGAGTLLMGVVGLVLFIACANVANLMLARAAEREKEIAMRVALGAQRGRLIRQLLTESVLMALGGGVVGLLVALWSREILWSFRPPFLNADAIDLAIDPIVLAFTLGISLLTGLVFGLVPALQSSNPQLKETLQEGGGRGGSGRSRLWLRSGLVVAEVALSVLTLVGAGLFVRSMQNAQEINPGFETDRLAMLFLNLDNVGYDRGQQDIFFKELIDQAETLPSVEVASLSQNYPFGGGFLRSVFPEGKEVDPELRVLTTTNPVSPGYFRTLGIPMLQGRDISDLDTADSRYVAVINEAMAEKFWPGEDPLGQRFDFYGETTTLEIVGVVADQAIQLGQGPEPIAYTAYEQWFAGGQTLNVRSTGEPEQALGAVQELIRSMEPNLLIGGPTTVRETLSQQLWAPRMGAGLLTIFGGLALLLAMIGVYGVMSNSVDRRAHEMGIRMALGAGRNRVIVMMIRQGMWLVLAGLGVGLAIAVPAGMQVQGMLFGLSGTDLPTYAVVSGALLLVAALATFLPARRLTTVDPSRALRAE